MNDPKRRGSGAGGAASAPPMTDKLKTGGRLARGGKGGGGHDRQTGGRWGTILTNWREVYILYWREVGNNFSQRLAAVGQLMQVSTASLLRLGRTQEHRSAGPHTMPQQGFQAQIRHQGGLVWEASSLSRASGGAGCATPHQGTPPGAGGEREEGEVSD